MPENKRTERQQRCLKTNNIIWIAEDRTAGAAKKTKKVPQITTKSSFGNWP